jgi:aspartyl protease family protein
VSEHGPGGGGRRRWRWRVFALVAAAGAVGLFALDRAYPGVLASEHDLRWLIYALLLLLIIGPAAFSGRMPRNLRNLAVWGALLALLVLGYTAWQQGQVSTSALRAELMPQRDTADRAGEARFGANARGDFVVEGRIDGVAVRFVVDTGASEVVLSRADAVRVGLDPDALAYTQAFTTANGTVFGAPVRLARLSVGGVSLENVRATVTDGGLNTSLLGMSFLGRLSGFAVRNRVLTLYQ